MPRIVATSIDPQFTKLLPLASLRVHSVFRTAVNLQTSNGTLLALVGAAHPPAPLTAVLQERTLPGRWPIGAEVLTTSSELICQDITVDLSTATPFHLPEISGRVTKSQLRVLAALLASHPLQLPNFGGLTPGVDLHARTAALVQAVRCGTEREMRSAARRLVGLGIGLTPSGDDFLAGFAFALANFGPKTAPVLTAIRAAATPDHTHAISCQLICEATRGRACLPLHHLLAALCGNSPTDVQRAFHALQQIGHTSGTDQAHGLLAATQLDYELRGTPCPLGR